MEKEGCNLRVHVRIRPLQKSEIFAGGKRQVEAKSETSLYTSLQNKTYVFDRVYNEYTHQDQVYQESVQPLIKDIINGFNVTVFAYGQTGTGKTYTMAGHESNEEHAGIIPRAIEDLYKHLDDREGCFIKVSFIELYNEVLVDLLDDNKQELRIMEKDGLNLLNPNPEKHVQNINELFRLFRMGINKRTTGSTNMNELSSRSHAVFTLTVNIHQDNSENEDVMTNGKVNFVDLAGSENIGRSGAVKQRANEAGKINQSLLAVGRVINALVDKSPHIPYRESKLTRILQDSLGGNTKTTLIATISPAAGDETCKTLDYAYRAKKIKNHPEQSKKLSKKVVMSCLTNEIETLKRDLDAQRSKVGIHLSEERYKELMGKYYTTQHAIEEREQLIEQLEQRLEALLEEHEKKQEEMYVCEKKLEITRKKLESTQKQQEQYNEKCENRDKVLTMFDQRFNKLQEEAKTMLDVVDKSSKNEDILITKVSKRYEASQENSEYLRKSIEFIEKSERQMKSSLDEFLKNFDEQIDLVDSKTDEIRECIPTTFSKLQEIRECAATLYVDEATYEYEKKISSLADKSVSCCTDALENFEKLAHSTVVKETCVKLAELQGHANALSAVFAKQGKAIKESISQYGCLTTFVEESLEKHKEFEIHVRKSCEGIETKMREQSQVFENMNDHSNKLHQSLESKLQAFFPQLNLIQEEVKLGSNQILSDCTRNQQLHDEINTEFQKLKEKPNEIHSSVEHRTNAMLNALTSTLDCTGEITDNNYKMIENELRTIQAIGSKLQETHTNLNSSKLDALNDETMAIYASCADYKKYVNLAAVDLASKIRDCSETTLEMGQDYHKIFKSHYESLLSNSNKVCTEARNMNCKFQKFTKAAIKSLENLLNQQYKVVSHEGDTPQRNVKYDVVVKRFQNVMEELKPIDFENDEELRDNFNCDETNKENDPPSIET